MNLNWIKLIVYLEVVLEVVASHLAVKERLLLAYLREQGTVALPLKQVHQQEELAAAEQTWLQ
jgi:hypothetical protein